MFDFIPDVVFLFAFGLILLIKGGDWFVDFKRGNVKYVVFKNKILSYHVGDAVEKNAVCDECRRMGISDDQMMWSE